jgi:glycerol-3-phosphate acyltransferase PlsY
VWLGFKGGKGVATNIGVLFGLAWPLGFAFVVTWMALAFIFRISSLSALIASASMPLWAWGLGFTSLILPSALIAAIIWIMHHQNIRRLLDGTESKINLKGKT